MLYKVLPQTLPSPCSILLTLLTLSDSPQRSPKNPLTLSSSDACAPAFPPHPENHLEFLLLLQGKAQTPCGSTWAPYDPGLSTPTGALLGPTKGHYGQFFRISTCGVAGTLPPPTGYPHPPSPHFKAQLVVSPPLGPPWGQDVRASSA